MPAMIKQVPAAYVQQLMQVIQNSTFTNATTTTSTWVQTATGTNTTSNTIMPIMAGTGVGKSYHQHRLARREELFYSLMPDDIQTWLEHGKFEYFAPDGSVVNFENGNVTINDKDAKVKYKSNPLREFNKYLSASDLVEEFIRYCDSQGITQKEFKDLPLPLFIMWLIVRVAETDNEDPGDALPLLTSGVKQKKYHRCKCCGRFLQKKYQTHSVHFCNGDHMTKFLDKIAA